jgi:phosphatidate phosphatase PAH1
MIRATLTIALLACGCGAKSSDQAPSSEKSSGLASEIASVASALLEPKRLASAKDCPKLGYEFAPSGTYRHTRTRLLTQSQGDPKHAAQDAVTKGGSAAILRGKFSYGAGSKDLEDEDVVLFLRSPSCNWLRAAKTTTDGNGVASFRVEADKLPEAGVYAFEMVVDGDGSRTPGWLFVVEPGAKAVVFDIDATLTSSDDEIIDEVLNGKVPVMRPEGATVAKAYADAGFIIAYVTGRPYLLTETSRRWLEDNGFPSGLVRTTDSMRECAPTEDGVGRFKKRALTELEAGGLDFKVAYGNAVTDICAYQHVTIDPQRTFILGPFGGQGCAGSPATRAIAGYPEHLADLPKLTLVK